MKTLVEEICWVIIGVLFTMVGHIAVFRLGITPHPTLGAPLVVFFASVGMMIIQSRGVISGSFETTRHWIIPSGIGVIAATQMISDNFAWGLMGIIVIISGYLGSWMGSQILSDINHDDDEF